MRCVAEESSLSVVLFLFFCLRISGAPFGGSALISFEMCVFASGSPACQANSREDVLD